MPNNPIEKNLTDSLEILKSAPDLYLILNPQFDIVEVSDAYLHATMVKREDILGRGIFEVFPDNPNDPSATGVKNLRASLERVLKEKIADTMAVQKYDIRRPLEEGGDFEERYWSPINSPVLGKDNQVKYIIHRVEDVTKFIQLKKLHMEEQKVTEELRTHLGEMESEIFKRAQEIQEANKQLRSANNELEHLAYFDTLTGLANRKQLNEAIKKALSLASDGQWKVAVMFLDLDQFKLINDTLGHKVGDQLLQVIAKRLSGETQAHDVVARLGGDEFVILLNKIKNPIDVEKIAIRTLQKIKEPIVIDNHKLFISGSIGISLYPENGEDEHILLKHADIAMYAAKQLGRNSYQFCTLEMINYIHKKMILENELRDALQENKFILYYQPQIDLTTGKLSGVEALLRLLRPDGSLLLPKEFIPLTEETGLIVAIGEWVLVTACTQYKQWEKILHQDPTFKDHPLKLGINFSARQLKEPGFLEMIQNRLEKTQFSPANLEFEITEDPIISDIESSAKMLQQLKKMGIHIALDDFGVGYSSLNYLREFHIDTLKIDQSLIHRVPFDKADSQIISSIIKMAHAMQIIVIAEGVETKEQTQFLIEHQCDKAQSHYFSKPLSSEEMTKLLLEKKHWVV